VGDDGGEAGVAAGAVYIPGHGTQQTHRL